MSKRQNLLVRHKRSVKLLIPKRNFKFKLIDGKLHDEWNPPLHKYRVVQNRFIEKAFR